jgi:hypothetical protein
MTSLRPLALVALLPLAAPPVLAQQPTVQKPYDGIQAGLDAYRLAEEQRQAGVARQLNLVDQARVWNGYPPSRSSTIYYGYLSPEAAYAYGYGPSPIYSSAGVYSGGYPWNVAWPPTVFTPWPYVPGDIYGYPLSYLPARQPVGQQQTQVTANHWESHPIYDPPLTPYTPSPPVDSAYLDRTPYAAPLPAPASTSAPPATEYSEVPPPPPLAPQRGPREY